MINPRKLWKVWRENLHSSPGFRLPIRRNEDHDDPFEQHSRLPSTPQTPSPNSSQNASPASLTFAYESPPSPVPDNDVKEYPNGLHLTPQYYLQQSDDDDSSNYSVTPPSSNPFPLMVSAKKLSSDIRSQHKRQRTNRRRLRDQSNLIPTTMGWRDSSPMDNNKECNNRYPLAPHTDEEEPSEDAWNIDTTTWSPTARNQHYWNICYGLEIYEMSKSKRLPQISWSAQRCPPTKSCLSSMKKRRRRTTLPASFTTCQSSPAILIKSSATTSSQQTPTVNIPSSDKKSVQFGALSAAEFQKDEPTSSAIKPLPQEDADRLFWSPKKITLKEKEQTERTKTNAKILADWETSFESDDDDSDTFHDSCSEESVKKRRRRSTGIFPPFASSHHDRNDYDNDEINENVMDIVSDTTTRQITMDIISPLCGATSC